MTPALMPAQLAELDALLDGMPAPGDLVAGLGLPPGATLRDVRARPGVVSASALIGAGPPAVVRAARDAVGRGAHARPWGPGWREMRS